MNGLLSSPFFPLKMKVIILNRKFTVPAALVLRKI